jgi:membrane protease YdiL (CAAX protease family)
MNALSLFPQAATMQRKDVLAAVAIIGGVTLTTLHRQACGVDNLPAVGMLTTETARVWLYFLCTVVLFGAVPLVLIRKVWKMPLKDFGVTFGDWKFGLSATAIMLPVIAVAFLLPAAKMEDMRAFYPVDKAAADSMARFLPYAAGRVLLFYVGWEFFFRGFLLFGLRESVGDITAICIQVLPSVLWHIGYPTGELYSSIAGGLLFGWLAIRTRSIFWPLLLHAGIGMITDISIAFSM